MEATVTGVATPQVLDPGQGQSYRLPGLVCRPVVRSEDSGDACTTIEITAEPRRGLPLHICHWEDETIYVVSGIFRVCAGPETLVAAPGTVVRIPRGIPREFLNVDERPSRLLLTRTPGGHDRFLHELSSLSQPFDVTAHDDLMARYGMSFCGQLRPAATSG